MKIEPFTAEGAPDENPLEAPNETFHSVSPETLVINSLVVVAETMPVPVRAGEPGVTPVCA
jgi:hypothetical protein